VKLWDRGAQPERTALAWSRTTLSLIVAGLLCVRLAPSAAGMAAAAAVVCGGAALLVRRTRAGLRLRAHRLPAGAGAADPGSIALMTGLALLLALVPILFTFG
jgi:putative membrane protein